MSSENQYYKVRSMNAHNNYPVIRVSFHTEDQCYQTLGKIDGTKPSPTNEVLAVTTQKQLSTPAGAFTITLAGVYWLDRLTSNDVVVIQMGYEGTPMDTVMVGLVDDVRETLTAGPAPTVVTTVTGRDFGKLLVQDNLKFYPEINGASTSADTFFLTEDGWTELMKVFTNNSIAKGTPSAIIDTIMRYIFTRLNSVSWTVYDETSKTPKKKVVDVGQVVRYTLEKLNFFMPFIFTADDYEGAIWNLMQRTAPTPFVELFIDTRNPYEVYNTTGKSCVVVGTIDKTSAGHSKLPKGKGYYPSTAMKFGQDGSEVVLVSRITPFDRVNREKLITHTVGDQDVLSRDLGRSDSEHYNLFWAGTTLNPLGIDLKRVAPPLMNISMVKRYGLSPLEVEIDGLGISDGDQVALTDLSKYYTAKLKAWFENNQNYLNGSLTIRGRGGIRIGQRLIYSNINNEFYVEAVSHTFNVFTDWTTDLTVTRGMGLGTNVDSKHYEPKPPAKKNKPKPKPTERYHVVVRGDTLWALAKHYYGHGYEWTKIWDKNKAMLVKRDGRNAKDKGHWIYPGQRIFIP